MTNTSNPGKEGGVTRAMGGARTPEELDTLFEDALVMRDGVALAGILEDRAVLVTPHAGAAHGPVRIVPLALAAWPSDRPYVAGPQSVIQARDLALVVGPGGINVARRGPDGAWRYAIVFDARHRTEEPMHQHPAQLEPVAVASSGGDARWWFDALAIIRVTAAQTGGQLSIVEVVEPPGAQTPLHVHHREDEGFWLLEGDAVFELGDTTIQAHAGDYLFGPRDIPHRYTVGPDGCRMLFLMTPGGFEDLVIGMSRPAGSRTLPPPSIGDPDWAHIAAVASAHGAELLG
jgi:quercetin dioxygenase-like cupin family protein